MGMSIQQAASSILANKDNYSPEMVKKAVFAHNFAKQDGGYVEGGQYDLDESEILRLKKLGYIIK